MSGTGAGLPDGEGGQSSGPTPLYCVCCLSAGLPLPLARIGDDEPMYADSDGQPVCSSCGFGWNLTALDRRDDERL